MVRVFKEGASTAVAAAASHERHSNAGADMLRAACVMAVDRNISICAPIHDAIAVEAEATVIADVVTPREQLSPLYVAGKSCPHCAPQSVSANMAGEAPEQLKA